MTWYMKRRSRESMKRLFNWFHRHYGAIEKSLGPTLERVFAETVAQLPGLEKKTAIEFACGSGLLTLMLARRFAAVCGRDISVGMLERARRRAAAAGRSIDFAEGDITAPVEGPRSYDYVFVSFAMHLFSPSEIEGIMKQLLAIAREGVVIIDHGRRWELVTAMLEWIEGGYYDQFIKADFQSLARTVGARSLEERQIADCTYLHFKP